MAIELQPLEQFSIERIVPLHVGKLDISYTNSALMMTIAVVLITALVFLSTRRAALVPGRWQSVTEMLYEFVADMLDTNAGHGAEPFFPFVFTLFVFILVSNLLGYIPLPVNSGEKFHIFGLSIPSFQIYAADTNVGFPLTLSLMVFFAYNIEGVRAQGFIGYTKSLIPRGVKGPMLGMIFPLEILSNFLRLLSLTIRLWANLLAGHLLIAFMAGDLAVLLGLQVLGWVTLPFGIAIFLFEAVLIAGLQAFIFAILAAIYLGGAVTRH